MEVAALALTDADNVTAGEAARAGERLRKVADRYREIDKPAARKAARAKKD